MVEKGKRHDYWVGNWGIDCSDHSVFLYLIYKFFSDEDDFDGFA